MNLCLSSDRVIHSILSFFFLFLALHPEFSFAKNHDVFFCARFYIHSKKPSLQADRLFIIHQYKVNLAVRGRERILFRLPRELTHGRNETVDLTVISRRGPVRQVTGALAKGECEGPWHRMRCYLFFDNFETAIQQRSDADSMLIDGVVRRYRDERAALFSKHRTATLIIALRDPRCWQIPAAAPAR